MKIDLNDAGDFDAIDRRILSELQMDGRITNVELARRAGISAPPCLRRVRRLEESGLIRGYHADTDPGKLGWSITFFVIVGLESQKDAVLAGFERTVALWDEVRECHMIRGGGDFLLRVVARHCGGQPRSNPANHPHQQKSAGRPDLEPDCLRLHRSFENTKRESVSNQCLEHDSRFNLKRSGSSQCSPAAAPPSSADARSLSPAPRRRVRPPPGAG
jgi:DNA-binding Lrp family transcriptional regulator